MSKHTLAAMTQAEFRERIARPVVILLPLGSQEPQGPHAPMGDYRLAERLAVMSAEAGDGLAAPALAFGHADFFRGFAGGMQLRPQTFAAMLEDMIGSFLDHDLNHLLIFNGHSANASLIDQVTRGIRRRTGIAIPSLNIWKAIPPELWRELYGESASSVRGHGGEPLTSVATHLFPEEMRPDLVATAAPRTQAFGVPIRGISGVDFHGLPLQLPIDAHEVDANAMLSGSPHMASAARGKAICDHIVHHTARLMAQLLAHDPREIVSDFPTEDQL